MVTAWSEAPTNKDGVQVQAIVEPGGGASGFAWPSRAGGTLHLQAAALRVIPADSLELKFHVLPLPLHSPLYCSWQGFSAAHTGLDLVSFLPVSPKRWDYRRVRHTQAARHFSL